MPQVLRGDFLTHTVYRHRHSASYPSPFVLAANMSRADHVLWFPRQPRPFWVTESKGVHIQQTFPPTATPLVHNYLHKINVEQFSEFLFHCRTRTAYLYRCV